VKPVRILDVMLILRSTILKDFLSFVKFIAGDGSAEQLEYLLKTGNPVDYEELLTVSSTKRNMEIVKWLVQNRFQTEQHEEYLIKQCFLWIQKGFDEGTAFLIEFLPFISSTSSSLMFEATRKRLFLTLKELHQKGYDMNAVDFITCCSRVLAFRKIRIFLLG
jgi:hypothetical protein